MKRALKLLPLLFFLIPIFASGCGSRKTSNAVEEKIQPENITVRPDWKDAFSKQIEQKQQKKPVIAVGDFQGHEAIKQHVELKLTDMFLTELQNTNKFTFFASGGDEEKAVDFTVSGKVLDASERTIDKYGSEIVQVEVDVEGSVTDTGANKTHTFSAKGTANSDKILRLKDGTIVAGKLDYDDLYAKAARAALNNAAEEIARIHPLIGYVVSTATDSVIIDIGAKRGAKVGDIFTVFRKSEEMDGEAIPLALISITSVEELLSTARILRKAKPEAEIVKMHLVVIQ